MNAISLRMWLIPSTTINRTTQPVIQSVLVIECERRLCPLTITIVPLSAENTSRFSMGVYKTHYVMLWLWLHYIYEHCLIAYNRSINIYLHNIIYFYQGSPPFSVLFARAWIPNFSQCTYVNFKSKLFSFKLFDSSLCQYSTAELRY